MIRTGTGGTAVELDFAPLIAAGQRLCDAIGEMAAAFVKASAPWIAALRDACWLLYPVFALDFQPTPRIRRRREWAVRSYLRARR
jgi:hypothetical protein